MGLLKNYEKLVWGQSTDIKREMYQCLEVHLSLYIILLLTCS
jgi:hypothetical protein